MRGVLFGPSKSSLACLHNKPQGSTLITQNNQPFHMAYLLTTTHTHIIMRCPLTKVVQKVAVIPRYTMQHADKMTCACECLCMQMKTSALARAHVYVACGDSTHTHTK